MHYFFDSAFPAGAYGHSFGFETFASSKDGANPEQGLNWIENYMVHSLWYGDLENISKISEILQTPQATTQQITKEDTILHASRSTYEGRKSAISLARAIEMAGNKLFASNPSYGTKLQEDLREPSSIVGIISGRLKWPIDLTRLFYLQTQALAATSVLVRCGRIGQFAQLEMMGTILESSAKLAMVRPKSLPDRSAISAWQIEMDQINHQELSPRLFQS